MEVEESYVNVKQPQIKKRRKRITALFIHSKGITELEGLRNFWLKYKSRWLSAPCPVICPKILEMESEPRPKPSEVKYYKKAREFRFVENGHAKLIRCREEYSYDLMTGKIQYCTCLFVKESRENV